MFKCDLLLELQNFYQMLKRHARCAGLNLVFENNAVN